MDQDRSLDLLYLLLWLILPVTALVARFRQRSVKPTPVIIQFGDHTYEGTYRVSGGMVFVLCEAGRRGTPVRDGDAHRTAEELLFEIYGLGAARG